MTQSDGAFATVAGISLITETNEQVSDIQKFLQALGLRVEGEDGFAVVHGPATALTIMRGAMVPMPRVAGVLLQLDVDDVDAAAITASQHGGTVGRGPEDTDWGTRSAFVHGPAGVTVELRGAPQASADSAV